MLIDLSQPIASTDFITNLGEWYEVPLMFWIQWLGPQSSLQEDALKFVEVILQAVIFFAENAWAQGDHQPLTTEGHRTADGQSSGGVKYLDKRCVARYFDHLPEQVGITCLNGTHFILSDRSSRSDFNQVGCDAGDRSLCQ